MYFSIKGIVVLTNMYDYLVIGAGASGMCFVDVILRYTDKRVMLVDRRDGVGGHWRSTYPYATLHMPPARYGIESIPLQSHTRQGILDHFEKALDYFKSHKQFTFQPNTEIHTDDIDLDEYRYIVDARYNQVLRYGSPCRTPWNLPRPDPAISYVMFGNMKTCLDTCRVLYHHGCRKLTIVLKHAQYYFFQDRIVFKRKQLYTYKWFRRIMPTMVKLKWLFGSSYMSLGTSPTHMFHGDIWLDEFEMLKDVCVRVMDIHLINNSLYTKDGKEYTTTEDAVIIDCQHHTETFTTPTKIMNNKSIVLQPLFVNHPCFSATTIAKLHVFRQQVHVNAIQTPTTIQQALQARVTMLENIDLLRQSSIAEVIFGSRLNHVDITL